MVRKLETKANGSFPPTIVARNLIGGQERDTEGQRRMESRSACNEADLVAVAPLSSVTDLDEACGAAREAFASWSATPAPIRGEILGRLGPMLERNEELLARLICREIGKPLKEARGEVREAIDTVHFFQSEGRRLYGQTVPSEMRFKELSTHRRPLGVAAIVTASNYPLAVPSWKLLPALACGNTVVWKPSEDAPGTAYVFGRLLEDAGVPPGVVNVVHGKGQGGVGAAILEAVDRGLIDKVSFTGSTAVGRLIGEVCGRNLQVPSLELGGKNPMVVWKDANLDLAVEGALFSGFATAGQRCTSLANLILERSIAEAFKAKLLARLEASVIADPTRTDRLLYGPLIAERFFKRFMEHFEMGRADGARLLTKREGRITRDNKPMSFTGDPDAGYYCFPAVWDQVTMNMKIAQTEIFGPTINIIEVGTFEEALAAANGTPYGLCSSLYSNNPELILRFKTAIRAGMTSINNTTAGAESHTPFGGTGWSGNGTRESGVWVLDAYSRWHAVNEDYSGQLQLAQIDVDLGTNREPTDFSDLG